MFYWLLSNKGRPQASAAAPRLVSYNISLIGGTSEHTNYFILKFFNEHLAFEVDTLQVPELRQAIKDAGENPIGRKSALQHQLIDLIASKNLDIASIISVGKTREKSRKKHPLKTVPSTSKTVTIFLP